MVKWFFILFSVTSSVWAEPAIPARWREFVRANVESNVLAHLRSSHSLGPESILAFREIRLPSDGVESIESPHYRSASGLRDIFQHSDGTTSFFQPVARESIVPTDNHFWGVKLMGHNSYFVWDSVTGKAFVLKIPPKRGRRNHWIDARRSVLVSRFVERVTLEDNDRYSTVLPECFAVRSRNNRLTQLVRSLEPIERAIDAGHVALPLYAFLGQPANWAERVGAITHSKLQSRTRPQLEEILHSDFVSSAAKAARMTPGEWLENEFAKELGIYLARRHFQQGIFAESHTQNLGIIINRSTGRILSFYGQDLKDDMFDPSSRFFSRGSVPGEVDGLLGTKDLMSSSSRNSRHGSTSVPWEHAAQFAGQVLAFEPFNPAVHQLTHSLLRHYILEAQRIAGIRIDRSSRSFDLIRHHAEAPVTRQQFIDAILARRAASALLSNSSIPLMMYLSSLNAPADPLKEGHLITGAFEAVFHEVLAARVRATFSPTAESQPQARALVEQSVASRRFIRLNHRADHHLRYRADQLIYTQAGESIGVFNNNTERTLLAVLLLPNHSVPETCGGALRRL